MSTLLEVRNLKRYFKVSDGYLHAVDDVSFSIEVGETVGIVGESGCGKSTLGRTVLRLEEPTSGQVIYKGKDISQLKPKEIRKARQDMQMIFQDPYASLDPRLSVGELIAEPLILHKICKTKEDLNDRVKKSMELAGIAQRLINSYPHELDGGRRQRVGIARALILNPSFIVCDEPVSALDVSIQAQILNLLMDLQEEMHLTYLFITHDLSVVKHISKKIIVMYLGQIVEMAPTDELFQNPIHPYTKALLSAIPVPDYAARTAPIDILSGEVFSPINPKDQCRFCSRCSRKEDICEKKEPTLAEISRNHFVSCGCISGCWKDGNLNA